MSARLEARMLEDTAPRPFGGLVSDLGDCIERFIQIRMDAYPSHWSEEDRREMARAWIASRSDHTTSNLGEEL